MVPDNETWEKQLKEASDQLETYGEFKGKLAEKAENLYQCLKFDDEFSLKAERLYVYARMRSDEDTANDLYQDMFSRAQLLNIRASENSSYMVPEILAIPEETLEKFIGADAELPDMLNARERRVWMQEQLLSEFPGVLVSFTLNIPGPVKVLPLVPEAFAFALSEIVSALNTAKIPVLKRSLILDKTGPEAFLCVDADALAVKRLLVPLEDASDLGRLYDIDIIGRDGKKISRSDIGQPGRTCLLCGRPARECSRSRAHSVAELTERINAIFHEHFS